MTIEIISSITGKVVDMWTWEKLLHICRGDEIMALDFIRHLKHNPYSPSGDKLVVKD